MHVIGWNGLLNLKLFAIAGALLIGIPVQGETLERSSVRANSKWVLHLDVDALRKSKIGGGIMAGIVTEQAKAVQKSANLDLPGIINGTHSITIYGADYESGKEGKGVLLWRGEGEIEQIAEYSEHIIIKASPFCRVADILMRHRPLTFNQGANHGHISRAT